MIVLGLTGSIGMGKSTAAKMLKLLGIPVHDSDKAVHAALLPGGAGYEKVTALFPGVVEEGVIDRKKLGGIVFNNPAQLKALEDILHPIAQSSQFAFIKEQQAAGKKAVVLEIPLLFETNAHERVHKTIVVSAPPDVQRARVMRRKGMTPEKFARIFEKQTKDEEKRARADYVVDTGGGYISTLRQIRKILKGLGL